MSHSPQRRIVRLIGLLSCIAVVPATAQHNAAQLDSARTLFAKYKDPMKAVHDGFLSTQACIDFPNGAMGVHFVNMQTVGPTVDLAKPQVVIYQPVGDSLELAGVEWFVPLATGVKTAPAMFGETFDGPMAGHEPIMPAGLEHYDLHVWLYRENPRGIFNVINSNMDCKSAAYTVLYDSVETSVHHH